MFLLSISISKLLLTRIFSSYTIMNNVKILVGNCAEVLKTLPRNHFNCCVTSPPYFSLRSYFPDAVQMRSDLTKEEVEYVKSEISKYGIEPIFGNEEKYGKVKKK